MKTNHPLFKAHYEEALTPTPQSAVSYALNNDGTVHEGYTTKMFTGLETANGEPIYEGDVLWSDFSKRNCIVCRLTSGAWYLLNNEGNSDGEVWSAREHLTHTRNLKRRDIIRRAEPETKRREDCDCGAGRRRNFERRMENGSS